MNKGELLGFGEVEYRPDQVMKLAPLCEKLGKNGWKPEIDLREGVHHLINWMSKKQDVSLKTLSGQELELKLPPRQN
jgi:nucleoside-diphosphate-sugar epimerase